MVHVARLSHSIRLGPDYIRLVFGNALAFTVCVA